MTRWKAAGIHLLISVCIAALVFGLLFWVWYPPPYFHAAGADELVMLLVGVDLALGPLLTLIVFRSGKKGLKLDLLVIGLVQSIALVYGLSVILESRPVFLVAAVDRFNLVSANQISDADLAEGHQDTFRRRSWTGPKLVAVKLPTDSKESMELALSGVDGKDVERMPSYYADYKSQTAALLTRAQALDKLPIKDAQQRQTVDDWLRTHQRQRNEVVWLPVVARRKDLTMMLDPDTGMPLGAVDVTPW